MISRAMSHYTEEAAVISWVDMVDTPSSRLGIWLTPSFTPLADITLHSSPATHHLKGEPEVTSPRPRPPTPYRLPLTMYCPFVDHHLTSDRPSSLGPRAGLQAQVRVETDAGLGQISPALSVGADRKLGAILRCLQLRL